MSNFSETYRQARELILSRAKTAAGWSHQSYEHPVAGVDGSPIYTDTFRQGPADAEKILVITSGTHGVEGFCGSALQSMLIADGINLPPNTAVLLIHAMNPFGFEHLRRVTHENVDLNRNFIDYSSPLPENAKYAELDGLLNPKDMPDGKIESIVSELKELQESMDFLSFLKAVSGGQYQFPQGIQYGGAAPTWSRQTAEAIWQQELSGAGIVVQIDLHTGLGPSGLGILMMAANEDEPHKAITADWFGEMLVTERPTRKEDVVLGGYLNGGMEECLPESWVIPMTLEFGTEPGDVVLRSMIEDNWLSHHGDIESELGQAIKERVKRAFYPDSDEWKSAVETRAREVFGKAIDGLSSLTPDMRKA